VCYRVSLRQSSNTYTREVRATLQCRRDSPGRYRENEYVYICDRVLQIPPLLDWPLTVLRSVFPVAQAAPAVWDLEANVSCAAPDSTESRAPTVPPERLLCILIHQVALPANQERSLQVWAPQQAKCASSVAHTPLSQA